MASPPLVFTPLDEIPKIHDRLVQAWKSEKLVPIDYRRQQILGLAHLIEENYERFDEAFAADLGRHPIEVRTGELHSTVYECMDAYWNVEKWAKPQKVQWSPQFFLLKPTIFKKPKGVVLIIGPSNYPIMCTLNYLVGAMAAGCAAVVKMPEGASQVSALVTELFPKYLDPDLYQVINGGVAEATAILELKWDHIVFTGSLTVGKIVAAAAAKHLTPTTLELGGQSPVFLDPNTDLVTATKRLMWAKMMNAGQTCAAPNHIFVPAGSEDRVIAAFQSTYDMFYPKGPADADLAHMINDAHFQRAKRMLEKTEGEIVIGGEMDEQSLFVAPTFVKGVKPGDALMEGEIFAPIMPIISVKDWQEALDITNAGPKPLVVHVFSKDRRLVERIHSKTLSGTFAVNELCAQVVATGLPFGGVGESGYGSLTGKATFDTFTHQQGCILDSPRIIDTATAWRFPPYDVKNIRASRLGMPRVPVVHRAGWSGYLRSWLPF